MCEEMLRGGLALLNAMLAGRSSCLGSGSGKSGAGSKLDGLSQPVRYRLERMEMDAQSQVTESEREAGSEDLKIRG